MAEACPPPPDRLPAARQDELTHASPLARVFRRGGRHPIEWFEFRTFGPVELGRFDHHEPPPHEQARGIQYLVAGDGGMVAALAEAFQVSRVIDPSEADPWLVIWWPARPLVLLDLTSGWMTRAGGNQAICPGKREVARQWSRRIHEQLPDLDGLFYATSTYGPGRSVALFERAADALPALPMLHRALAEPELLPALEAAASVLGYPIV